MFLLRRLSGKYELGQGILSNSNHTEDDGSEQVLNQASEHVKEGNYEKALWLLEKLGQLDPTVKGVAELVAVAEVSYAAVWRSCSCFSRENRKPDWYKILKVDEKSELGVIKKRYRHLALLLHPDKNKHVKAEAAFKLVSEAYACLSDKKKRANFNVRRSLTKCRRCSLKDCISSDTDRWSSCKAFKEEKTGLQRAGSSPDLTHTDWILDQEQLKIFRSRARARVFANLARVWKERGFTRTEEAAVGKERSSECRMKQAMMTPDQHGCNNIINKTSNRKENLNTRPEASSMSFNNEMHKASMEDVNHAMISRPHKNLGVLIRDLQAELVSSIESTGEQKSYSMDVSEQSFSRENVLEADTRDSGDHAQGGADAPRTTLGPRAEEDFTPHLLVGALRACSQNQAMNVAESSRTVSSAFGHSNLDGIINDFLSTSDNDACSASDFSLKKCSNKGFSLCERRRESFTTAEPDFVVKDETQQKDKGKHHSKSARDEECDSSVSKKFNLCRRTGRGDSLDLEETILQNQKEKSEELLKTLQRLREETKTVAACLDHFCSTCNQGC